MDVSQKSVLAGLVRQQRFTDAAQAAELFLQDDTADCRLRYCAAIAWLWRKEYRKAFAHFFLLLQQARAAQGREQPAEAAFNAQAALQCGQLAELLYGVDVPSRPYIFEQATALALELGAQTGDRLVMRQAERLRQRLMISRDGSRIAIMPDSPYVLQIEPTNCCNLQCRMCPRTHMSRKRGFISVAMLDDIFGHWRSRSVSLRLAHLEFSDISFTQRRAGEIKLFFLGEPLLHPKFHQLVLRAKQEGCISGIQTNGLLLERPAVRRKLLTAAPAAIGLSIDGFDADSYAVLRAGSAWSRMHAGLRSLHAERESMGLREQVKLYISTIIPAARPEYAQAVQRFLAPLREFVDEIRLIPLKCHYNPEFFDEQGSLKTYTYGHPEAGEFATEPLCREPFEKMNVLWDGTVAPCCCDIDGRMSIGTVAGGIDTLWQSRALARLQRALIDFSVEEYPLCQACLRMREERMPALQC
ncbi:MAG: radical SAM protein [Candidatus Omnitrophica bacterium]|nr:radical SAM protein [Candidatus Omnitrophota bacterium]